jgi:hypothetical protein
MIEQTSLVRDCIATFEDAVYSDNIDVCDYNWYHVSPPVVQELDTSSITVTFMESVWLGVAA